MVPPVVMLPRFQSTHPSGVRRFLPTFCPHYSGFQSTHPSGVRPAAGSPHGSRSYFNPRTPVGCDTPSAIQSFHCLEFQSTHPSGVRLTPPESRSHSAIFQSTHPSGVRPGVGRGGRVSGMISIHAPQWGATWPERTWASTPTNFNPRTPVGCDAQTGKDAGDHFKFQSTHPSGVRPGPVPATAVAGYFNPRTPVGCDRPTGTSRRTPPYFNPRTPVGCDDNHLHREIRSRRFQSTHPSGVRPTPAGCTVKHYQISIHAPQWGATGLLFAITCDTPYFNPRTPVGCDHPVSAGQVHSAISIHAPQWGATEYRNAIINVDMISIHAPQWGATES
mgnify:CR=1 FL=1